MKNWTIGKRIVFGFSIVIFIAGLLGVFSWTRLLVISKESTQVAKESVPGLVLIQKMQETAQENYIVALKHVLASNAQEFAEMEGRIKDQREATVKRYQEYEGKISTAKDKELFEAMKSARPAYTAAVDEALRLSRDQKKSEAMVAVSQHLHPAYTTYMGAIQAEVDFNRTSAEDSGKAIQSAVLSAKTGILIGLITAVIAGIGVALVIIRSTNNVLKRISNALDDGSNHVASAASQVAASSQTLAEGSSEQAASLEETSSSLEEMSSMTKRNAENAQKANDLARQARTAADHGAHDMQEMSQAMNEIKTSSDDIGKIIKTIDEIAFQTNILALNAAVEAARAGEAGMGFAVVADEVRNLAQRSAQAAKETAGKIEGAIAKTSQGVEISTKVASQLQEIVTKVRQVDELVSEVTAASKEQSQGIEQVNTAVGQMDTVTQSAAASAEECASAAEELNAQADSLKANVHQLLQLVGGKNQGTLPPATGTAAFKPAKSSAPQKVATRHATVQHNGNSRFADQGPELVSNASKRSAIPMEGDFKNFNS